jgi:hypothetical protein
MRLLTSVQAADPLDVLQLDLPTKLELALTEKAFERVKTKQNRSGGATEATVASYSHLKTKWMTCK